MSCSQALSCTGGPVKAWHQPLPYGDADRYRQRDTRTDTETLINIVLFHLMMQATLRPLPTWFPSMSRWTCWSPPPGSRPPNDPTPPSSTTARPVGFAAAAAAKDDVAALPRGSVVATVYRRSMYLYLICEFDFSLLLNCVLFKRDCCFPVCKIIVTR